MLIKDSGIVQTNEGKNVGFLQKGTRRKACSFFCVILNPSKPRNIAGRL